MEVEALSWVDGVLGLVALLYAWQAFERGVVPVLNELCAWLIAWVLGLVLYRGIAGVLFTHLGLSYQEYKPWCFLLTVLVAQILVYRALGNLTSHFPRHYFGKGAHFIIGILPALINGAFFALYLGLVLLALPFQFPFKVDIEASLIMHKMLVHLPMITNQ